LTFCKSLEDDAHESAAAVAVAAPVSFMKPAKPLNRFEPSAAAVYTLK